MREHCGVELGFLEAQDMAKRLLRAVAIVRDVALKEGRTKAAQEDAVPSTSSLSSTSEQLIVYRLE